MKDALQDLPKMEHIKVEQQEAGKFHNSPKSGRTRSSVARKVKTENTLSAAKKSKIKRESPESSSSDEESSRSLDLGEASTSGRKAGNLNLTCLECSKTFPNKLSIEMHLKLHKRDKKYDCKVCGEMFSLRTGLHRHMKTHLTEGDVYCEFCSKSFDKNYKLLQHKRRHHEEKKYSCEICSRMYSEKGILARHMRVSHTARLNVKKEKIFHCKECSKSFSQRSHLNRHTKITHRGEKCFLCEYCSKTFAEKCNLSMHMMRIHSDKNPGQINDGRTADQRDKSNLGPTGLKRLIERRFVCQFCYKKFVCKNSLEIHTRTHTGEKPFSCEVCGKSFRQKSQFQIHSRTHTGEKPFSCPICFKRFNTSTESNGHMVSHTKEKAFLCEYCSKAFGTQGNLHKHKKIYHKDKYLAAKEAMEQKRLELIALLSQENIVKPAEVFSCIDCSKVFSQESDLVSHAEAHVKSKGHLLNDILVSGYTTSDESIMQTEIFDALKGKREEPATTNHFDDLIPIIKKEEIPENTLPCNPMNADEGNTFDDVDMKTDDESDEEIKLPTPPPSRLSKKRKSVTKSEDGSDHDAKSVPGIKRELCKRKNNVKENNSAVLDGNDDKIKKEKHQTPSTAVSSDSSQIVKEISPSCSDTFDFSELSCTECLKTFKTRMAFVSHVKIHAKGKIYDCKVCKVTYTIKSAFDLHMKSHVDKGCFACDQCPKTFDRQTYLTRHEKNHGEKNFVCDKCPKTFCENNLLKKHMKTHIAVKKEKTFHCKECTKSFIQHCHLVRHVKIIHKNEKHFLCEYCSKTFFDVTSLSIHMVGVHKDISIPPSEEIKKITKRKILNKDRFGCSECFKRFPTRTILANHTRTHTGEKPFSCEVCGKRFTQKGQLLVHTRIHTGEKKYSCHVCFKRFKTNAELESHSRTHTGEKPFVCEYCSRAFPKPSNLLRHKKNRVCRKT